jgi:hypothetical protein
MKKKIEVGSQLDINAAFDGGAADTSVTYLVPPGNQQDVIEVDTAGVVTALAIGTATVEINDAVTGDLLRAIVIQVLSAEDFAAQEDLGAGETELQVEIIDINSPVDVSGADAGNNYVSVTFSNTMAVTARAFQVGIRAVGSAASSTSGSGRFEHQNSTFSGIGPHTVQLLSAVADGAYEVYVQDLVNMTIGSALVTINTEDFSDPIAVVSANWSPYTNLITVSWSASDPETGITSKTLDLRSQDGASVLINNQSVTADADSTMTAYIEPNDTTYTATLTVINGDGLSKTVTATAVVPPIPNQPTLVSGVDNGNNTITISWTNSVWAKYDSYQVGIRHPNGAPSYTLATVLGYSPGFTLPEAQTTVGPLSYTLIVPESVPTGVYEIFAYDLNSEKLGYASVSYVKHDITAPTISLSAEWQANQFTISWSASDLETAVASKTLDIRTSDGSTILLNNQDVMSDVDSTLVLPHAKDGKTYVVTFKSANADGFESQTTRSISVPQPDSFPQVSSVSQQFRSYSIDVNWGIGAVIAGRTYQIGIRPQYSNTVLDVINNVTVASTGPFTNTLTLPSNYTSGNYVVYVSDNTTGETASEVLAFVTPPTLVRVNPYMVSNTQKGPYAQFASVSSGVASASSISSATHDAYVAFDGTFNDATAWRSGAGSPQWLGYQFESTTTIEAYTLYGTTDGSTHWTDWQFQGSSDGINWTALDTRTGESRIVGGRAHLRTYILAQPANYAYYRIYVTALGAYAGVTTTLGEMSLQAYGYGSFE